MFRRMAAVANQTLTLATIQLQNLAFVEAAVARLQLQQIFVAGFVINIDDLMKPCISLLRMSDATTITYLLSTFHTERVGFDLFTHSETEFTAAQFVLAIKQRSLENKARYDLIVWETLHSSARYKKQASTHWTVLLFPFLLILAVIL